jgi:hypothetical protein
LDGLFQRIVSYPITTVLDSNAIATISRTVLYDPRPEIIWKNGTALMPQDLQLDSLIYPFWQGKGIIPGVEFDCSTSKCTYDPFYTLALDFECTPIPDFLEFGCRNTSGEWLTTTSYSNFNGTDQIPKVTSCGYYMNVPNHQAQLMSGYEVEADGSIGEVLSTRIFPLMDIVTNEPYLRSPNFDVKTPVVDFILASTPGGFAGARQNSTPVVTECEIHWVVKKLKAEVSLGVLVEEVLETLQFETVNSDNPYSPWDGLNSPIWLGNFSMDLADPHSPTSLSTFGLDNTTAKKVWAVWAEIAPSTFNLPADNNPVKTGPVQKVLWGSQIPDLQAVSDPILPWDTPNNVTQHMADAVKVMNQVIRRNALSQRGSEGRARDVAIGHAWIDVRFVKVNWAWITMPLALLLISGAFLLATVIRTSDGSISIGKTSGLGYLFNDTGERRMSKWLAPEQSPKFGQ